MEQTGLNQREIRARNLSSILYLLNSNGSMSRKDIADALSLTPAAVTKLCSELIELGFINEKGEEIRDDARAGRRKILLSLKLSEFYVLCVNAEVDKITVSCASLDGKSVCLKSIAITDSIDEVISVCKEVMKKSKVCKDKYLCTSVCVIGLVEDKEHGLWDNISLKQQAEKELGLPVIIDNNIRAFAFAELIYADRVYDRSVLFLKWGPGIGSAVASNGEVLSGNNSAVAEIGHYIIRRDGKKCRCGRYGCLETEASSMAIEKETGKAMSFSQIIKSENNEMLLLMESKIDEVALALTNTATILNAEKIILFGTAFENENVAKKLARQCFRYNGNLSEKTIELSKLNGKSSYIGALALAAKTMFFEKHINHLINGRR